MHFVYCQWESRVCERSAPIGRSFSLKHMRGTFRVWPPGGIHGMFWGNCMVRVYSGGASLNDLWIIILVGGCTVDVIIAS